MTQSAPTPPDAAHSSAFSPLRYPIFRQVWLASGSSNLGGLIQSVGASWLMTSIAPSPDMVALVQTSVALPVMLCSLAAGAMADSFDRRKMMISAQSFMLVMSVMLSLCTLFGWITPWVLLMFTFLIGCGNAFNLPAWQASVGDMVPRTELPAAVALNTMGFNIARSVGPAIGGAIVAAAGAAAAFTVNSLSYIALIVVLARWRPPASGPQLLPRETLGAAIASGVRYVALSPAILTVLIRSTVFGVGASAVMALMPLIARDLIAGGPLTFGLLLGSFGVGAVSGALNSARLRDWLSTEGLVRFACVMLAIAISTAAISNVMLLTMAALLFAGASWVLALSTFNVTVQLSTPRWVVARALSLYQMATFGGMAVGSWLWGELAEDTDIRTALWLAAIVLLICTALGLRLRLSKLADLNLDPLARWQEPSTAVPVDSRTGPVVIAVEYLIDEDDVLEFLHAMDERRRQRRRDGAHSWRLLRDLSDPRLWVERYETSTWLEYVRHHSRLTFADAVIPERLRALHRGTEPPKVRRMLEKETSVLPAAPLHDALDTGETLTDPTQSS